MSVSPSPSTSAACTLVALFRGGSDYVRREGLIPGVFKPGEILSTEPNVERMSVSPSLSTSTGIQAAGHDQVAVYDVGGEVGAAVVLVPSDLVVIFGRGEHVGVAVAVYIRGKHASRPVGSVIDHVLGEVFVAVVLVPGDVASKVGRGEDVGIAVAVHVGGKYAFEPRHAGLFENVIRREVSAAVILVPEGRTCIAETTSMSRSPSTSAA